MHKDGSNYLKFLLKGGIHENKYPTQIYSQGLCRSYLAVSCTQCTTTDNVLEYLQFQKQDTRLRVGLEDQLGGIEQNSFSLNGGR